MYPFLIISGHISEKKRLEFEHTFRIGLNALTGNCLSKSIAEDQISYGEYHFFSIWKDEDALQDFLNSGEYQLLTGAFHSLGKLKQITNGQVSEIM
jgi:quinol monooxygenase YgiN